MKFHIRLLSNIMLAILMLSVSSIAMAQLQDIFSQAGEPNSLFTIETEGNVSVQIYTKGGISIAYPSDWIHFKGAEADLQPYMIGDGKSGIPIVDYTGSPVMLRTWVLILPLNPKDTSLESFVKNENESAKAITSWQFDQEPRYRNIELDDGENAYLTTYSFFDTPKERQTHRWIMSVQSKSDPSKVYCLIISIVSQSPASEFVEHFGSDRVVTAVLKSFTQNPQHPQIKHLISTLTGLNHWIFDAAWASYGGIAYYHEKDMSKSEEAFEAAIKADPENPLAYNYLAWVYSEQDRISEQKRKKAIEYALKAVELTKWKDATVIDTLAEAYYKHGHLDDAISTIKMAISLPKREKNEYFNQQLKKYEMAKIHK